ncbi:Histone-lysine N-methyltransferase SUVR5 [Linum grandiflorum]
MEVVLPHDSGVRDGGEGDSSQHNMETVDTHVGAGNSLEEGNQVENASVVMSELMQNLDGGSQVEGQTRASDHQAGISYEYHDFDEDDSSLLHGTRESCPAPSKSDAMEIEPTNSREGEHSFSEPLALWVKWRGKWQAGIRCARADWPLSTLRAKPTHDRKQYFVVFFPNTRNYSWADMLLVRSISETPEPIAYRTHKSGLKLVKDLSVARRFIMQKLAVGMLNIVDQFHNEALVESARSVLVWKEFAMEASRCSGYGDLGRMLLKLQNMILQKYIEADWLSSSFQSWVQQCQVACSAESVELLREELYDSIMWNKVNSLGDASVQSTLGSEWKTWKHEVMKWFSTSHPLSAGGETEHRRCNSPSAVGHQVNLKRPKLVVRRAEPHASQVEMSYPLQAMTVDIDSEFFSNRETTSSAPLSTGLSKVEDIQKGATPIDSPSRWDGIVVEAASSLPSSSKGAERTPTSGLMVMNVTDPGSSKNRQCTAFIQSKGRQCVRWANEGDVYCCVHLASRFTGSSAKGEVSSPVHNPLCEGTTVLGTRCKHRSLPGSSFCKKHGPKTDTKTISNSLQNSLKRKHDVFVSAPETSQCRDIVLFEQAESPLQVEPVSVMACDNGDSYHAVNGLSGMFDQSSMDYAGKEVQHCVGSNALDNNAPCHESPKRYTLYCDSHIPSWLKRARNGRSRIISKEVFLDLLNGCSSLEQKLHLHKACELFYKLFKSILSLRNPVPMEVQLQWALAEASKELGVGEYLLNLVSSEKERLKSIWGLGGDEDPHVLPSRVGESAVLPTPIDGGDEDGQYIRCKICSAKFTDDQQLCSHWMENHKKEAQWLFRGHACAICLDSFTNKKGLETHVQDRHHVQFVEQCMLLLCIPCKSHFGNAEQLWSHVCSVHPLDFRVAKSDQQLIVSAPDPKQELKQTAELDNGSSDKTTSNNPNDSRKFICRFCGLKFDLLPDLGRHHQAAHMGPNILNSRPQKKRIGYYAYRSKSGRLTRPRFKKGMGTAAYRIRNRANASLKKRIQATKSLSSMELNVQPRLSDPTALGRLVESQCSAVAKILFSEIQKTKPRPNNPEILATARSACCRVSLKASLEGKYGLLPERFYLKAAKLCSEHNIQVEWHHEGFVCHRGCKSFKDPELLSPLVPLPNVPTGKWSDNTLNHVHDDWLVDECHYIIDLDDVREERKRKVVVLCQDISFGKESIPIACVADKELINSFDGSADSSDAQNTVFPRPWESFTYLTNTIFNHSSDPDFESLQVGCSCPYSVCCSETCDHVYLFDNDYEDAKDIYGAPMHGRFPYDDKGRIILEEGYLVYECNNMCSCKNTCPNRVLQNGVRVRLEVFKTENKGWAVRAGEHILRGTFICEYIGEVIGEDEANNRRTSYGEDGCSYMYSIDDHTNDMSRMIQGEANYVIDATTYGNVSRFINHSCLPNLETHQVVINSMDSQRAHIGLYASRDIAYGEELTHNYRYNIVAGQGHPCHCGTSRCRGRLY